MSLKRSVLAVLAVLAVVAACNHEPKKQSFTMMVSMDRWGEVAPCG